MREYAGSAELIADEDHFTNPRTLAVRRRWTTRRRGTGALIARRRTTGIGTACSGYLRPRRAPLLPSPSEHVPNQIADDGGIGDHDGGLAEIGPRRKFPNLERNQRCSDDGGQPLGPAFLHP